MSATAAPISTARSPLRRAAPFIAILVLFALAAVLAPLVAPYDPNTQNLLGRLKPPGTIARNVHYLLGSDELGRDLLSRLIWGARVSLLVAVISVVLSGIVGTVLGMLAGYLRGVTEIVVMRVVDVFLSVPAILVPVVLLWGFAGDIGLMDEARRKYPQVPKELVHPNPAE